MSCVLDTNKGTDSVLEHHHIHVTYTQYRFPQAYYTKKHVVQYFCRYSTYLCVPSMYSRKIVRTWYVLLVQSTYLIVLVHTHTNHTHTSFPIRNHRPCNPYGSPSDTVRRFAGSILPIGSLLDCQAAQAWLATSKLPQPRVNLIDVAATPAILRS